RCAGRAHRRIHLATALAAAANEVGAHFTFGSAPARDGSDGGRFSLELSLAAALSSCARALRGARAAIASALADRFRVGTTADRCHDSDVDLRLGGRVWTVGYVGLLSDRCYLGVFRA